MGAQPGRRQQEPQLVPVAGGSEQAHTGGAASYACWVAKKRQLPELMARWAKATPAGGRRNLLESLAVASIPQEWVVWALADSSSLNGGGGFYIEAPCEPQVLIFLQAGESNLIHHVAVSSGRPWPGVNAGIQEWVGSMRPKKCLVQRPEDFAEFGLTVPM
mmetsp:Transcript_5671/g.13281  ORF Transcript_5671/g.13281 Transcript_5671/m.13281 type:complete len:161 (+) Transcript_5671:56-538(+)